MKSINGAKWCGQPISSRSDASMSGASPIAWRYRNQSPMSQMSHKPKTYRRANLVGNSPESGRNRDAAARLFSANSGSGTRWFELLPDRSRAAKFLELVNGRACPSELQHTRVKVHHDQGRRRRSALQAGGG